MKWKGLENHNHLSPVPKDFSLYLFSVCFFATHTYYAFSVAVQIPTKAGVIIFYKRKICAGSLFRLQQNWWIIRLEKLFWKQLTDFCYLWMSFGFSDVYEQLVTVHVLSDAQKPILSLSSWSTSLSTPSSTISALGGVKKLVNLMNLF